MTEKIIPQMGDEIPEDKLKTAEAEVKSNQRILQLDSFRGEKDVEIGIFGLTPYSESLASGAHSRVFCKLLKDPDIMTRKQLSKVLEEKGAWGEAEDNELSVLYDNKYDIEVETAELRSRVETNEEKLKGKKLENYKKKVDAYKERWLKIQRKINDLLTEKTQLLFNSVERHAEEAETKVKLSQCVKFADGTPVWPTVADLDKEEDSEAIGRITHEALFFWRGLSPEIIQDLPANILFGGEEDQETK